MSPSFLRSHKKKLGNLDFIHETQNSMLCRKRFSHLGGSIFIRRRLMRETRVASREPGERRDNIPSRQHTWHFLSVPSGIVLVKFTPPYPRRRRVACTTSFSATCRRRRQHMPPCDSLRPSPHAPFFTPPRTPSLICYPTPLWYSRFCCRSRLWFRSPPTPSFCFRCRLRLRGVFRVVRFVEAMRGTFGIRGMRTNKDKHRVTGVMSPCTATALCQIIVTMKTDFVETPPSFSIP